MTKKIENLTKAKTAIVLDHSFFASLLLSMPMNEDSGVATMATNGECLRYNPEFMASLSMPETTFVLAHEVMHCVFQHMDRRGNRDLGKYNIAADYIINDALETYATEYASKHRGVRPWTMPQGGLLNADLVKRGGGTTEGVYALLPDSCNGRKPGDGQGEGAALDEVSDAGTTEAEKNQKEAERRVRIIQAANAAKMYGKLSSGIERLVKDATESRVDWRAVLRRFLSVRAKSDFTYARPKRRFLSQDMYLPSLTGQRIGDVVIAVDCSGSIDDKTLSEFQSEIQAIVNDVSPPNVHVLYFDSEICGYECFENGNTVTLKAHGGGGTAFSPIFQSIEEKNIAPVACIVLTDLCCSDFGESPAYPVLWASIEKTSDDTVPFGETVYIKE